MKKGMIKVSVIYPNTDGKKFDINYYTSKHLELVGVLLLVISTALYACQAVYF